MNSNIKKAIEKLKAEEVEYRILELGGKGISSKDVEELTDINPVEITKTIVLTDGMDNYFAAFLPGREKIDLKKVRKIFGSGSLRLASAKELKKRFGLAPGEVCPVLISDIPFVVDEAVMDREKINFGSGDVEYGIEIRPEDLKKFIDFRVEDISS